ncbi:MAG: transglutaminase domain-containing protein [Tannerellaceae bacterium]|jgi:transglutaminase-like putative cysteine protease|nr:transglutaminase domain-containing protein [Tannerellaceae bacterium]
MKRIILSLVTLSILLYAGCTPSQGHFIKDTTQRALVAGDFEQKKQDLPEGNLFADFDTAELTNAEREAMMFLYAYMPIGDATDYNFEFYLNNVRSTFRTLEEVPWGKDIPDDVVRHFVLPVRVNNENLDDSRMVFYEELKERVKHLSLHEAVLEVNHWCHEKVIYSPSDSRTSSPLASVKTAYGRCGEESVFAVAALRSAGIPARQVYTPRWAHTDDNHAWVEAWIDGKWHFMGACEPEPVLNMAWFNSPARRSMLMHSKVFGRYGGAEEVMEQTACYTEINVTANYAPTATLSVNVIDEAGKTVEGADVEFKLYNYAEFYTVSRKKSDKSGSASLSAGKGDMLVWASDNGKYGFAKASFGKDETVTIILNKQHGDTFDLPLDIIPPVEGTIPAEATDEQKAANALRLLHEDSIRNTYASTFYAADKEIPTFDKLDKTTTDRLLIAARGNHRTIETFLRNATDKQAALSLLDAISSKDLRDITAEVLEDHLRNSTYSNNTPETFAHHVRNPRVSNEMLTPYKSFFQTSMPEDLASKIKANPQTWVTWVADSISLADRLNPQRIPVSPAGVWKSRRADAHSRDIFFVSVLRSLGVPSRIEQVAGKVQYASDNKWMDVDFNAASPVTPATGTVSAGYTPGAIADPEYYSHFTIARILPEGRLRTLNFETHGQVDMGWGDTWSRLLKKPLTLEAGDYLLVTGSRMAKGNVLAQLTAFHVEAGKATSIQMNLRENAEEIQVVGSIDAEARFKPVTAADEASILSITGRGYFVLALLTPNHEPTNHALHDISSLAAEFDKWGRPMLLIFKDRKAYELFNAGDFAPLPSAITYGTDEAGAIGKMLTDVVEQTDDLPMFVIADTFGRVVFASHGYTIGLGAQMMQIINKL